MEETDLGWVEARGARRDGHVARGNDADFGRSLDFISLNDWLQLKGRSVSEDESHFVFAVVHQHFKLRHWIPAEFIEISLFCLHVFRELKSLSKLKSLFNTYYL